MVDCLGFEFDLGKCWHFLLDSIRCLAFDMSKNVNCLWYFLGFFDDKWWCWKWGWFGVRVGVEVGEEDDRVWYRLDSVLPARDSPAGGSAQCDDGDLVREGKWWGWGMGLVFVLILFLFLFCF